jgi:hypothetical protein
LIYGASAARKSTLFFHLLTSETRSTHTSLIPNQQTFVPALLKDDARYRDARYHFVEVPGHPRRSRLC